MASETATDGMSTANALASTSSLRRIGVPSTGSVRALLALADHRIGGEHGRHQRRDAQHVQQLMPVAELDRLGSYM
jgi:hypothetical protein